MCPFLRHCRSCHYCVYLAESTVAFPVREDIGALGFSAFLTSVEELMMDLKGKRKGVCLYTEFPSNMLRVSCPFFGFHVLYSTPWYMSASHKLSRISTTCVFLGCPYSDSIMRGTFGGSFLFSLFLCFVVFYSSLIVCKINMLQACSMFHSPHHSFHLSLCAKKCLKCFVNRLFALNISNFNS